MPMQFSASTGIAAGQFTLIRAIAADFNQDGKLDLITPYNSRSITTLTSPSLAVLFGDGTGKLSAPQPFAVTQASQVQKTRYVFNTATMSLVTEPYFETISTPLTLGSIVTTDINGDGKLDLLTLGTVTGAANVNTDQVLSVLLGNGAGGFVPGNNLAFGKTNSIANSSLVVGDFNGDRRVDIAAMSRAASATADFSYSITVALGDGTGGLSIPTSFSTDSNASNLVTADFNGNRQLDLAYTTIARSGKFTMNASVLPGDGTGKFGSPLITNFDGGSGFLLTGDWNRDNRADLVLPGAFLAGDGDSKFRLPNYIGVGSSIATGDFNGDGRLDLVTSEPVGDEAGNIAILLGDDAGHFSTPLNIRVGTQYFSSVLVGDFNGDGKSDIFAADAAGNGSLVLNTTPVSDSLVISGKIIDASIESNAALNLDLTKRTLRLGGIKQRLVGNYSEVYGTAKADRLTGKNRNETLLGKAGNDVLVGLDGKDDLNGGKGNDVLTGGKGKDNFQFKADIQFYGDEQVIPFDRSWGVDKLTDFTPGQDHIVLSRSSFTALKQRRVNLATVKTVTEAGKSRSTITYIQQTGNLFYNENGAKAGFGTGGQFADLPNGLALTPKNFTVL